MRVRTKYFNDYFHKKITEISQYFINRMVILINPIQKSFLFYYLTNQKTLNVSLNATNVGHKILSEVEGDFIAHI